MRELQASAQEALRPFLLRPVEDVGGDALLDDLAAVHEDDAVADVTGEMHLVRDDEHRHAVTHEMQFEREVGDRLVFMDEGRIVEQGLPADVLDRPREERTRRFLRRSLQLAGSLEKLSVTDEEGARA